ncbi:phosphonate metabolism protein/1,5-bisphosphokinase (PRPP-forming) PhnN [Billgrantia kenyensis]|uniref:Ribose 1,5-bisphosphate phosphokinase PhnN n=1 Tax=Billgrantia kenyensis TaxID=321266 RepID=A0A7W0ADS3_9GAMM|nr:phosphonate metabolism protein/1,5-bisphosphokinase (PRPP-forming) PhnN [Halomonas kenyensis]MBA2779348.1 phosphonate metabolism protein/1,5-bisphosphokinase (PRPP-forming) PhnN [Halomonas kenyensis]MCG6662504.1 phosphonate metabolism protein/1,5-bisphosphokinase (PRPP-forming) PhnN [Halomonas kenyensis]
MARLVYLMGASGVGKDTLLATARNRYPEWLVAHRYITRESGASENSIALSAEEFAVRRRAGLFCLSWEAHGLSYGLGIELEAWLGCETMVLVNGSRRALPDACRRFGERLLPILITAPEGLLRQRLLARGRETPEAIEARLVRHRQLATALPEVPRVDNAGTPAASLAALARLVTARCVP